MKNLRKSDFKKLFVDYKPAELKQMSNDDWCIVFYVKIPGKEKMKRFRKRVLPLNRKIERPKYAQNIISGINKQLERGWSPFFTD